MRNISSDFRRRLYEDDYRNYVEDVYITLANNTELHLTNENLWGYGFYIDDAVSADNVLEVGSAIVGMCQVVIENISETYNLYDFNKAKVVPYVGLDLGDGTVDVVKLGEYYVSEAKHNTSCITLTCYDAMTKFDKPISLSGMNYPATLNQIIANACSVCGVPLATQSIPHGTYSVAQKPDGGTTTFRELLAWAGQISGRNARINVSGQLEYIWYDQQKLNAILHGQEVSGIHKIDTTFGSPQVSLDDVTITQISVSEEVQDEEGHQSIARYTVGTSGYTISIENNKLVQGNNGSAIAQWLLTDLSGFRFRKASFTCLSDPSIEAGDILKLTDRKGNAYACIVSATKFQVGNPQSVRSSAADPERTSVPRNSEQIKNYVGLMTSLGEERAARADAERAIIGNIDANTANIEYLRADVAQIDVLQADLASFKELTTGNLNAVTASINSIRTEDLAAVNADISNLEADYANINTILAGNVGTGQLQTITLTAQNTTVANQFAQNILASNAIIGNLATGQISTTAVTIASDDGGLNIAGNLMQFKDGSNNVRIQIGKDGQGTYSFGIYDASGNPLWYNNGITADAVPDGTLVNDMFASKTGSYKGIDASKLNINSVKGAIEQGGFSSSLIYFDEEQQTLNQIYSQITADISDVDDLAQQAKTAADSATSGLQQVQQMISGIDTLEGMMILLTNEAHVVHTYNDGTGGNYSDANTQVMLMVGETDVTNQAIIDYHPSSSVSGTWNSTTKVYQLTGMSAMDGYVDFSATYGAVIRFLVSRSGNQYTTRSGKKLKLPSGAAHMTKRFSISKAPDGQVGTSYSLMASAQTMTRSNTNTLSPQSVTFSAIKTSGNTTEDYQGYYKIEETSNWSSYTEKYSSSSSELSKLYTPSSGTIKGIRCTLYDNRPSLSSAQVLDVMTVTVIADADGMQTEVAAATQGISTLNTKYGEVKSGVDGLTVNLAETNTQLHGLTDKTLLYQTPYTWSNNGATANLRSVVYKAGVDVTNDYPSTWFNWFLRTEEGEQRIQIGKNCSVSKSSLGYGGTVVGRFTTYDSKYLTTRSGKYLLTRGGNNFVTYVQ